MDPSWVCMLKKISGQTSLYLLLVIRYDILLVWYIFFKVSRFQLFWKSLIQTKLGSLVLIGILITLIYTYVWAFWKSKYCLNYVFIIHCTLLVGYGFYCTLFLVVCLGFGQKDLQEKAKTVNFEKDMSNQKYVVHHQQKQIYIDLTTDFFSLMHTQSGCLH